MRERFARYQAPAFLLDACAEVGKALSLLPRGSDVFGLIHYDFEPDNVLYDEESGCFGVIDFDDAIRCRYTLDIARAIETMDDVVEDGQVDEAAAAFLEGYRSKRALTEEQLDTLPLMRKLALLQEYATIIHVPDEKSDGEPGWMQEIRGKLSGKAAAIRASFSEDK